MTDCTPEHRRPQAENDSQYEQVTFTFGDDVPTTLIFDADDIVTDAGLVPLRQIDERLGFIDLAARRIEDLRVPEMIVHPVPRLLREVVFAYAAGYEDANDHTPLRNDPLFKQVVGPINPKTVNPKAQSGLASEATLSRLLGGRKLEGLGALREVHVEQFAKVLGRNAPDVLTLDIDGYDAETHGMQQLALFNGYYEEQMYYPLHVSVAEYGFVVGIELRPGDAGPGTGAAELLAPIIEFLRARYPKTKLRVRADAGFADPKLYALCEENGVEYANRMKMNNRLDELFAEHLIPRLYDGRADRMRDGKRIFYHETMYRAGSWDQDRRVVLALVQDMETGEEARRVLVTNSAKSKQNVWSFYEHRGQSEQRIDEFKNHLRGEKLSCCEFANNAIKLELVAMAHNLLAAVRILLPEGHELKRATVSRLRLVLIKCAAMVKKTTRRLWLHASKHWPYRPFLMDLARMAMAKRWNPTPVWDSG